MIITFDAEGNPRISVTAKGGIGVPAGKDTTIAFGPIDVDWTPIVVHVFGDKVRVTIGGSAVTPGRYVNLSATDAHRLALKIKAAADFIENEGTK